MSNVLRVCDVRVGVLPVVMRVQVYYLNENNSLYTPFCFNCTARNTPVFIQNNDISRYINPLAPELFLLISAHSVYKM